MVFKETSSGVRWAGIAVGKLFKFLLEEVDRIKIRQDYWFVSLGFGAH